MPVRNQDGGAAAEFAIILVPLVMLIFGIIEFGLILYDQAVITNASREGARFGIVFQYDPSTKSSVPPTTDEIKTVVDNYAASNLVTFSETSTAPVTSVNYEDMDGSGDISSGDYRIVAVSYNYSFLVLPNFATSLAGDIDMQATTRMRME